MAAFGGIFDARRDRKPIAITPHCWVFPHHGLNRDLGRSRAPSIITKVSQWLSSRARQRRHSTYQHLRRRNIQRAGSFRLHAARCLQVIQLTVPSAIPARYHRRRHLKEAKRHRGVASVAVNRRDGDHWHTALVTISMAGRTVTSRHQTLAPADLNVKNLSRRRLCRRWAVRATFGWHAKISRGVMPKITSTVKIV